MTKPYWAKAAEAAKFTRELPLEKKKDVYDIINNTPHYAHLWQQFKKMILSKEMRMFDCLMDLFYIKVEFQCGGSLTQLLLDEDAHQEQPEAAAKTQYWYKAMKDLESGLLKEEPHEEGSMISMPFASLHARQCDFMASNIFMAMMFFASTFYRALEELNTSQAPNIKTCMSCMTF